VVGAQRILSAGKKTTEDEMRRIPSVEERLMQNPTRRIAKKDWRAAESNTR
jgi:hypothetical protein